MGPVLTLIAFPFELFSLGPQVTARPFARIGPAGAQSCTGPRTPWYRRRTGRELENYRSAPPETRSSGPVFT